MRIYLLVLTFFLLLEVVNAQLLTIIEPYLLKLGFLQRTPRGRVLSELGCKYLGISKFKNTNNQFSFIDDLGF